MSRIKDWMLEQERQNQPEDYEFMVGYVFVDDEEKEYRKEVERV